MARLRLFASAKVLVRKMWCLRMSSNVQLVALNSGADTVGGVPSWPPPQFHVQIPFMLSVGWEHRMHVYESHKHQCVAHLIPAINAFFPSGTKRQAKTMNHLPDKLTPTRATPCFPPRTGTVREFCLKSHSCHWCVSFCCFVAVESSMFLRRPAWMYIQFYRPIFSLNWKAWKREIETIFSFFRFSSICLPPSLFWFHPVSIFTHNAAVNQYAWKLPRKTAHWDPIAAKKGVFKKSI